MASVQRILKELVNVNGATIHHAHTFNDASGVQRLRLFVTPYKRFRCLCPECGRKCPGYDQRKNATVWRDIDAGNGTIVEIEAVSQRVRCPEHGVVTASVPWAYPGSRFTKSFDMMVAWLAKQCSRSAIAELMRIDWETVGNCVSRARNDLEADVSKRLDGLKHIGIDETSYKKGYKFITVIVNHDTGDVVAVLSKHGKEALEAFFQSLTQAQRESIEVVTADGAGWIRDCVEQYLPNCTRCIDSFHVVQWIIEALDEVRIEAKKRSAQAIAAEAKASQAAVEALQADENADPETIKEAIAKALELKTSHRKVGQAFKHAKFTLGKAPENRTAFQNGYFEVLMNADSKLCKAFSLKEEMRLILKGRDPVAATQLLNEWISKASRSHINSFIELSKKIRRHFDGIINTVRLHMSNARIESINNKIKGIVRRGYGFRNLENLKDLILLCCSSLSPLLPGRPGLAF